MRGYFLYLRFKTFPMKPRTPQCEVFWALLSNSKHSGVPEDSKSPTLEVLGFTPTFGQSGVATLPLSSVGSRERLPSPNFPQLNIVGPLSGFNPGLGSASQTISLFWFFPTQRWKRESWNATSLGRGATQALKRLRVGPLAGGYHKKSISLQHKISEGKAPPKRNAG